MPEIMPFTGYVVKPEVAERVVAPAYDSVTPEERRQFADAHPDNFINTMKLLADMDPKVTPDEAALLAHNKAALQGLIEADFFNEVSTPAIYLYELSHATHTQIGVVCEVSVEEYKQQKLKKHENTVAEKEDLLAAYQRELGVTSSPICVTYAKRDTIMARLSAYQDSAADIDFVSEDGVRQRVWQVSDSAELAFFSEQFANVEYTYLTDGHHRAASGVRYAEMMAAAEGHGPDDASHKLLIALFSDAQLNLLPFHRVVTHLVDQTPQQVLDALDDEFGITTCEIDDITPDAHGQFGMILDNKGYKLTLKHGIIESESPLHQLDVSILQEHILAPVLGIIDSRSDPRLDYISGTNGIEDLKTACQKDIAVAFACHATSVQQLMDVADANELMPPKSTYFDPKARSGIFVRFK